MNILTVTDKLPYSQYSPDEVLIFNSSDNKFWTIREGQCIEIKNVPQELYPMLEELSINFEVSDESLEPQSVMRPAEGIFSHSIDTNEVREMIAGEHGMAYVGGGESLPIQPGKLSFQDSEDSDDNVDDLIQKIEGLV